MPATKTTRQKPAPAPAISGMGSILHSKGVYFRVWAPHAQKIFVVGEFNNWADNANELIHEGNGYWGTNISNAKAGQQYKYVLHTEHGILYKTDPYSRQVTSSAGNSIIIDPAFKWSGEIFQMPSWNKLVIYEMHVGTFNRKDPNKPGNFEGVIEKLPYLKELGINAIEIMPLVEFPGSVSWGYNPSHPFAIETDYGGVQGFKKLVNEAHRQGIAVILDIVYNHFGPGDLDIWQFDGWSENNGGGIYFYQDWKKKTPWGDSRPDYGRPEVRQYIRDNALMWLEEYQVDGLRTDAIAYIRNVNGDIKPEEDIPEGWSLMQWINKEVKEKYPWKITIAEDLKCNDWITKSIENGGEGFSSQWDAAFVHPVRNILTTAHDEDRNMIELEGAILARYNDDAFERVIYTESHDEVANGKSRVPEEISPENSSDWFAKKRSVLGAVVTLTSPGIPMLFQGQELLEGGYFSDTNPLDWTRFKDFRGINRLYRDLIKMRTNATGLTKGLTGQDTEMLYINNEEKVIAYHRWEQKGPKDSVMVVLNFADRQFKDLIIPFPLQGLWKIRFNSDWKGYDPEFGNELVMDTETLECNEGIEEGKCEARVNLAPYSAVIYSMD
jgi:1,4-alpha-glucan branching enzyme